MYKVCIKAAGVGSRLSICNGLHKSLIPINKKSILSRIIDLFPQNTEFIILVGYKKDQIKAFLDITYPKLNIKYVEIKKFRGTGSGPGYSLLQAKKFLNCPFIFMACDTIVLEKPPPPLENWIGISESTTSKEYLIAEINENKVTAYYDKKDKNFIYKKSLKYTNKKKQMFDAFIGLAGIRDFKVFWKGLESDKILSNGEIQVTSGLEALIREPVFTTVKNFTWIDTGSNKSYSDARRYFKDNFMTKSNEFLYKEKNKIIKCFLDPLKTNKLYERSKFLEDVNPAINKSGNNFIWYNYVKGTLISNTNDKIIFLNFLNFLNEKLWKHKIDINVSYDSLKEKTNKFYKIKTYERVGQYLEMNSKADDIRWINNNYVESVYELLKKVDWEKLKDGSFGKFHGDPQPENIIVKNKDKFVLIDWREDFGGDLEYGDIYYDLAKIYHALIITHKKIREKKYHVHFTKDFAFYKFSKRRNLIKYLKYFEKFILKNNFDLFKVKLISSLIYLNIAPLHHNPYSQLLFFHGKLELYNLLKKA